jgi:Pyridoxamine 5'-phosphate oxidase
MAKGFALAWNPAVAMSKEEIDVFLSGRLIARIASVGKDNVPHINPVWYYWDGVSLFIVMKQRRLMARNLARNPWCSVVIDTDDRPIWGMWENRARGVIITGRAELHAPEQEITIDGGPFKGTYKTGDARKILLRRYGLGPNEGALCIDPRRIQEMLEKCENDPESLLYKEREDYALAKIRPEKLRAWDFSKAAPKDSSI